MLRQLRVVSRLMRCSKLLQLAEPVLLTRSILFAGYARFLVAINRGRYPSRDWRTGDRGAARAEDERDASTTTGFRRLRLLERLLGHRSPLIMREERWSPHERVDEAFRTGPRDS